MYAYSFRVGADSRIKSPVTRATSVLRDTTRLTAVTTAEPRPRSLGAGVARTALPGTGQRAGDAQR